MGMASTLGAVRHHVDRPALRSEIVGEEAEGCGVAVEGRGRAAEPVHQEGPSSRCREASHERGTGNGDRPAQEGTTTEQPGSCRCPVRRRGHPSGVTSPSRCICTGRGHGVALAGVWQREAMGDLQHLSPTASADDVVAVLRSDGAVVIDDLAPPACSIGSTPSWRRGWRTRRTASRTSPAAPPAAPARSRPGARRRGSCSSTRWSSTPPGGCSRAPPRSTCTSRRRSPSAPGSRPSRSTVTSGRSTSSRSPRATTCSSTRSGRSPTSPRPTAPPASCPAATTATSTASARSSTATRCRRRCRAARCSSTAAASTTAAAPTPPTRCASASTSPTRGPGSGRRRTST